MTLEQEPAAKPPVRVIFFRRMGFYGDFKAATPRWHILKGQEPEKYSYGLYTAWCGYSRSKVIGDLKISRSKTHKRAAETCARCATNYGKDTSWQDPIPSTVKDVFSSTAGETILGAPGSSTEP